MSTPDASEAWNQVTLRERAIQSVVLLITLIIVLWSFAGLGTHWPYVFDAPSAFWDMGARMWPPDLVYASTLIGITLETIHMAILGTLLALAMSVPVSLLAAENISPNAVTLFIGKFITAASRSVNTIIWAILFVIVFGAGPLAGVVALGVRSIGFCSKLLSEAIEEISRGQVEAIQASGGNLWMVLIYSVIPQIKPAIVGVGVYRGEINIRDSTILGLVGAGGIGVELGLRINMFHWSRVLTILLVILALVMIGEVISAYLRNRVS